MKKGTIVRYNGTAYPELKGLIGVVQATRPGNLYPISNVRWNSGGKLAHARHYQYQFNNSITDDGTQNYYNCGTDELVVVTTAIFRSLKKISMKPFVGAFVHLKKWDGGTYLVTEVYDTNFRCIRNQPGWATYKNCISKRFFSCLRGKKLDTTTYLKVLKKYL